jgi:phage shock protein PspC (stress-responsive transcriptional regulator)
MIVEVRPLSRTWTRSRNGWLTGLCEGIGNRLNIEPNLIRAAWLVSILFFGTGLFFYILLSLVVPREDLLGDYNGQKVLGVCHRLAKKTGHDLAVIRVITTLLFISSFGMAFIGYLALYLFLPENSVERTYY